MAEVVHRNLELMLPELEELERSGIFSPEEIKWVEWALFRVSSAECFTERSYDGDEIWSISYRGSL